MNQYVSLSRTLIYLLLFFAVIIVVPLVALATYNHPSPTDDYCFTDTVLQYGFWRAQQFYYDGWTGRYFHNFIVHTNPLVIGWYEGYKIYPILFLLTLVASFYALASQWLYRTFGTLVKVGLAVGLFIGFITTLASLPEYLYWYTGLASYGLSSALFLLLLATFIAHQRQGFKPQLGYWIAEGLLVTAIIGSSEMTMVLILSVLGMIAFVDLLQRRRVSPTILFLAVVAAVSCYYLFKAPGNAIRIGGNPNSRNISLTLGSSLGYMIPYVIRQLGLTSWIPLSLLYLPIAQQLTATNDRRGLPPYLRVHPLLGMAYAFATILALISLHYYGVGISPIPRLINVVNLTFWLSWLYCLTLWVVFLQPHWQSTRWLAYTRPVAFGSIAWVILSASLGSVLPLVYSDWLSGRASQYDRAMEQRYVQLAQSNKSVSLLAPLPCYPASLFLEDIHTDPKYLWNRCWADYYHKKTVILATAP